MQLQHFGGSLLTFSLSTDYGYVLLAAVALAFQLLLIGFIFTGKVRSEVFTEEFMKKNFGEEHRSATGKQIEKGGYPDVGNGRYSSKLTYDQWYRFNNAQRAHYNFLEFAPSTFVMLFIAGIYFPIVAAILGALAFVGRLFYAVGYANGGPQGRLIGALIGDLVILGLFGLSAASSVFFIMGKTSI